MLHKRVNTNILWGALVVLVCQALLPATTYANHFGESSVPAADTPGATLNRTWYQFDLEQNAPYMYRPVSSSDATNPAEESPIIIQEGVLPEKKSVQGILMLPKGKIIISP